VCGANGPGGELSSWRNVLVANRPRGESSRGRNGNEMRIRTARRTNRCGSICTASKVGLGLVYRVRVSFR